MEHDAALIRGRDLVLAIEVGASVAGAVKGIEDLVELALSERLLDERL